MWTALVFACTIVTASMLVCPITGDELTADIIVYAGTAGGVVAAVAAARMNRSVILLNPTKHLVSH